MRVTPEVLEVLVKGFSPQLTHINLDYNAIEKEGMTFLAKQLQYGQGGDYKDAAKPDSFSRGRLLQSSCEWHWTHLSIREYDINDFALDDVCSIVNTL